MLNFVNERLNANYRYSLIRIKEYAESVAFYAGEKVESSQLYKQFGSVINNMWDIVYRTLNSLVLPSCKPGFCSVSFAYSSGTLFRKAN